MHFAIECKAQRFTEVLPVPPPPPRCNRRMHSRAAHRKVPRSPFPSSFLAHDPCQPGLLRGKAGMALALSPSGRCMVPIGALHDCMVKATGEWLRWKKEPARSAGVAHDSAWRGFMSS